MGLDTQVKRLLFHAFAVMLGVLEPTDEQDLRTKRVNTPEMVVAGLVRREVRAAASMRRAQRGCKPYHPGMRR